MKRAGLTLALLAGAGLLAAPMVATAMGSGGMGGGGTAGASSPMPDQPEYDPAQEYQAGDAALQAGHFKDAILHFQRVVDATPRASEAWLKLGLSKAGTGDERGAEKAFERSEKVDDTSVDAHRELALAEIKLNQPDKASAELATLKSRQDTCHDSCSDAADLKAAIAAIQAAMPSGSATQGAATKPTAANDVPASLSVAAPQTGDGAYVRAVSLINERRWDEALASLDRAEQAIGPHPDILTYKGYVWRHKGDWAQAEAFYKQALAMNPDHRGATEYYGELKVLKGDIPGAKAMLARLDQVCTFGCAEAEELRLWIDHGGDPDGAPGA